jgi:hypothetical protein
VCWCSRQSAVGVVGDIEDVHQQRLPVAGARPPSGPGHHPLAAQGEPQPFRAPPAGRQVAAHLVVELVRQPVEQVQLIGPADRAQGQVMLVQHQGLLRLEAPCLLRDQLSR